MCNRNWSDNCYKSTCYGREACCCLQNQDNTVIRYLIIKQSMVLWTDISHPEHIHAHRKFFVFAQKLEKSHINSRSCEGGLLLNGTLATWPTMTDWFVMLVSVGQKRREADVSTALGYISRRRVHTPNQECVWYLVWRGRRGWLGTKRKEEWKRRKGGRKRWRDRGNKEGREGEINKGREGGRDQQRKGEINKGREGGYSVLPN